ncbi:MAG: Fur family transcriptional regulator [Alphaproteobacteria bacterium]
MTLTPDPLTRNQRLVLDRLTLSGTPLSAYAILDELRPQGFRAPPQVYRALDKLVEAGLVHRIESMNAFVACAEPASHGGETVVFMLCERCGAVDEFVDTAVTRRLDKLGRDRSFHTEKRMVEIRGSCADCSAGRGIGSNPGID